MRPLFAAAFTAFFFIRGLCADPVLSFTVEDERATEDQSTGGEADFVASVDRARIENSAAVSVAQVLELAPGVQVTRTGSAAQGSYVSVRGSSPEQVLVLLNGKRLNSAQGGGVDLSSIDPSTIEKIEILRGGAATRYGENALGGVVNIITRSSAKAEGGGSAYLQYGSWNTAKAGASIEGMTEDGALDGYLSLSGLYSEGAYGYESVDGSGGTTTRENADVRAGDLYGTGTWYADDYLSLKGVLTAHADEKGVPGLPQFPTTTARMEDQLATASVDAGWERDALRLSASLASTFHRRRYVDPEYALGAQADTHLNFSAQSDLEAGLSFVAPWASDGGGTLIGTTSGRFDALRSTALVAADGVSAGAGEIVRCQGSASLRAKLPLFDAFGLRPEAYPSARFDASLTDNRIDEAYASSSAATWQFGLVQAWKAISLKANIGTSYRSPSFDDLFWPSTAFAKGNPSLKPERAFSWDAGVELTPLEHLRIELSYFDRFVSDLIVWSPTYNGQWSPANLDSARVRGVELQGTWSLPLAAVKGDLVLDGTASFLDPRNTTSGSVNEGNLLPNKAPFTAAASAELKRAGGLFFRTELSYTSYRYITAANTKALDPALVFNLGAGLAFGERWKLVGRLENVFDVVYYDLENYPVPGREFSVRLGYEW